MKKIFILIIVILCFSFSITAYAEEVPEAVPETVTEEVTTTQDASQPRLMVSSYAFGADSLSPDTENELKVVIKNYSNSKAVSNIKLSVLDESGDIKAKGTGTQYVDRIYAGSTYTWKIPLSVSKIAQTGEHKLTVSMEYEDKYYTAYSASDTLSVNVKQTVDMDYNTLELPVKVTQGDTVTVSPNVINTGKSTIRNCKVTFDIDGIESGGALFVGEIPAGESKNASANLRVGTDVLGEVKGTATIVYEDEFGESYKKTADISTLIEEKVEIPEEEVQEEEKKNNLWWLFVIIGAAAGGALGFGIPTAIRAKKQRKEDEMRL